MDCSFSTRTTEDRQLAVIWNSDHNLNAFDRVMPRGFARLATAICPKQSYMYSSDAKNKAILEGSEQEHHSVPLALQRWRMKERNTSQSAQPLVVVGKRFPMIDFRKHFGTSGLLTQLGIDRPPPPQLLLPSGPETLGRVLTIFNLYRYVGIGGLLSFAHLSRSPHAHTQTPQRLRQAHRRQGCRALET